MATITTATTDLPPTLAERAIRRRIARRGPITFADFMAAALYGPGGYYTRPNAGVDYYTGPQAHPAFGALLAVQLFHLWTLLERPRPFNILELGAGDGLLCRDILTAARYLPGGFGNAISYAVVDQRAAPGWEQGIPNARRIVADALSIDGASADAPAHCVLSNELLDALPVHRVRVESGQLRELYVALGPDVADGYEGSLVEIPGEPSTPALQRRLSDLGIALSDGQTAEICLLLDAWAAAAARLQSGFALTIDYGRAAGDLYDYSQRPHGTLVTYRNHRQTDAPLQDVGRQDITAQVDFTAAQLAGQRAGLTAVGNVPQGWLLHRLGLQTVRRNGPPPDYAAAGWLTLPAGPDGLPPDALPDNFGVAGDDGRAWRTGLTHLAQPGGLGDFRVLLQAKGVAAEPAAAALSWLDGGADADAKRGYTPSSLAALIPPDVLRLGPERVRIGS